jgi:putative Holliday junction resolvase
MKGRIVAIDYGLKRTGIAWTDPLQIIASPVGCLDTNQLKEWLIQNAKSEYFTKFLLGYPTHFDRSDTHITKEVRNFYEWLQKEFSDLEVILWDERLTSKMALKAMIEANFSKKKRSDKRYINAVAATIMLQEYLEGFTK